MIKYMFTTQLQVSDEMVVLEKSHTVRLAEASSSPKVRVLERNPRQAHPTKFRFCGKKQWLRERKVVAVGGGVRLVRVFLASLLRHYPHDSRWFRPMTAKSADLDWTGCFDAFRCVGSSRTGSISKLPMEKEAFTAQFQARLGVLMHFGVSNRPELARF